MKNKRIILLLMASLLLVGCNEPNPSNDSESANSNSSENTSSLVQSDESISEDTFSYDISNDTYKDGNYYAGLTSSLKGEEKFNALSSLISSNYKSIGYNGLWSAYATTDVYPGTNTIWDIYSNCKFDVDKDHGGNYSSEGDCYNREHTTPQGWWGGGTGVAQGNDIFNVYPTDGKVNGMRDNYPYGEVENPNYTSQNGSKLGPSALSGYSGKVFEPIDEYKGDLARTYFYMATRYSSICGSWTKLNGDAVYKQGFPYLTDYALKLFLKWSEEDPVSQKEIDRNNAAYKLQGNRNPYIDHESYVYEIFGNKTITNNGGSVTPSIKNYEVVDEPKFNTQYKLGCEQSSLGKDIFFDGDYDESNSYYLGTTDAISNGVDVTLEETDGGFYLSFLTKDNTKKYLNAVSDSGKYSPKIENTPSIVWEYDATYKTFVTNSLDIKLFLNTHGSFATFGVSDYSKYIGSSYLCHTYQIV